MRLLWSLILTGVALAVAIPLLERVRDQDEGEGASGRGWLRSSPSSEPDREQAPVAGTFYRWRDANGTVHLESTPPPVGTAFEAIGYQTKSPSSPEAATVQSPQDTGAQLDENPLRVYTPDGIEELMKQVDQTATQLKNREKALEQLKDQL